MAVPKQDSVLNRIATEHSYAAGFNGFMAKYRIEKVEIALRKYSRDSRVLELGAGEGQITEFLASRFNDLEILEPAETYLHLLKTKYAGHKNIRIHAGMYENSKIEGQFPVIVAAGVLEHVEEPIGFLQKAKSQLAPGGSMVLTVPNAGSLHRRLAVEMGMMKTLTELSVQDHAVGHFRYYDAALFRQHLRAAGFTIHAFEGILLKPFPNSQMSGLSKEYCDALYRVGNSLPEWGAELFAVVGSGN